MKHWYYWEGTFTIFEIYRKSRILTCIVYGETGKYPLSITVEYYDLAKILIGIENKRTSVIYRYLRKCYIDGPFLQPRLKHVHNIINSCG